MRVSTATLALLLSGPAAARECQTCSMADVCMKEYVKTTFGGPKGHQASHPGLEAEFGQKGLRRIVQQGHTRIARRHGGAGSYGAGAPEGVLAKIR
jgi:hypothetical protein